MLKLIPINQRAGKVCAVCGETRSVKYMADIYDDNDKVKETVPMCNMCALDLSLTRDKKPKGGL